MSPLPLGEVGLSGPGEGARKRGPVDGCVPNRSVQQSGATCHRFLFPMLPPPHERYFLAGRDAISKAVTSHRTPGLPRNPAKEQSLGGTPRNALQRPAFAVRLADEPIGLGAAGLSVARDPTGASCPRDRPRCPAARPRPACRSSRSCRWSARPSCRRGSIRRGGRSNREWSARAAGSRRTALRAAA